VEYQDDAGDGDGGGGCTACGRAGGLLLLGLAGLLGYMGMDLVTGGALTRLTLGALGAGAAAATVPADSDNEGQEVTGSDDSA